MAKELLDELRTVEIPPLPEDFDDRVHHQLNHWLVASHLLEFAGRALPVAFGHFAAAVLALAAFSLTGRFDFVPTKGENDES